MANSVVLEIRGNPVFSVLPFSVLPHAKGGIGTVEVSFSNELDGWIIQWSLLRWILTKHQFKQIFYSDPAIRTIICLAGCETVGKVSAIAGCATSGDRKRAIAAGLRIKQFLEALAYELELPSNK